MSNTPTSAALKKLASTLVSPLPPPGSVRQRKQTTTFSVASTSNAGTPAKRGRGRPAKKQKEESEDSDELTDPDDSSDEEDEEEEGAGGTGTPRSGSGNRRARVSMNGEDLWTEEMDEALIRGMKKIPKMGRRSIVLESDGETYGRVGLLGEYLRRQTGMIRNRTQCASHMTIQKKRATKQKDNKMLELIDGTPLGPSQDLYKLDFDSILGPDRHPETLEAAAEENRNVKALRTALNDARRSGGGGSVPGSAKKRGRPAGGSARKKRKIETEDDEESGESSEEESSSGEEEEEEKVEETVPVKRKRGRPRKHPLPVDAPTKPTPSSTKKPKRPSTVPRRKNAPRRSTLPTKQKQEDDAEMSSDLSSAEESENERVVERKKPVKPATSKKSKSSSSPAKMDVDDESGPREGAGTVAIRAQEPPQTGSWLFGGLKKIISWF